ncbi:MAG TPA: hypothetical protein VFG83_16630 [Kofleriaceae bacterium]|nr:hypothetical protein [Kofleriaceae bacterium]
MGDHLFGCDAGAGESLAIAHDGRKNRPRKRAERRVEIIRNIDQCEDGDRVVFGSPPPIVFGQIEDVAPSARGVVAFTIGNPRFMRGRFVRFGLSDGRESEPVCVKPGTACRVVS